MSKFISNNINNKFSLPNKTLFTYTYTLNRRFQSIDLSLQPTRYLISLANSLIIK